MSYDRISPDHYKYGRKYEPIDVIHDWGLNYNLGCAVKYISRNGRKPEEEPIEGLEKAIFYLNKEIEVLRGGNNIPPVTYEDILLESLDRSCDYIGQAEWDSYG